MTETEQLAIEAVKKHFSAYKPFRDGRIAVDVAVIAPRLSGRKRVAQARLREDKVAQRVLRALEDALRAHVPDGKTIVLTLGAPIKVPRQLIAALTDTLLAYLASGAEELDVKKVILDNRVRFRVVNDSGKWNAKVIGFVFTGDPAPGILADAMRSLCDAIVRKAKAGPQKKSAGERWLVLLSDCSIADIKTYRRAYSLIAPSHHFKKILMLLDGARVEVLAET
jgi:hypothetical protein